MRVILLALCLTGCANHPREFTKNEIFLHTANLRVATGEVCMPESTEIQGDCTIVHAYCFRDDTDIRRTFAVRAIAGNPGLHGCLTADQDKQQHYIGAAQTCAAGLSIMAVGFGGFAEANPVGLPLVLAGKVAFYYIGIHKIEQANLRGESIGNAQVWGKRIAVADCAIDAATLAGVGL